MGARFQAGLPNPNPRVPRRAVSPPVPFPSLSWRSRTLALARLVADLLMGSQAWGPGGSSGDSFLLSPYRDQRPQVSTRPVLHHAGQMQVRGLPDPEAAGAAIALPHGRCPAYAALLRPVSGPGCVPHTRSGLCAGWLAMPPAPVRGHMWTPSALGAGNRAGYGTCSVPGASSRAFPRLPVLQEQVSLTWEQLLGGGVWLLLPAFFLQSLPHILEPGGLRQAQPDGEDPLPQADAHPGLSVKTLLGCCWVIGKWGERVLGWPGPLPGTWEDGGDMDRASSPGLTHPDASSR